MSSRSRTPHVGGREVLPQPLSYPKRGGQGVDRTCAAFLGTAFRCATIDWPFAQSSPANLCTRAPRGPRSAVSANLLDGGERLPLQHLVAFLGRGAGEAEQHPAGLSQLLG
jgi:hypothetical protein